MKDIVRSGLAVAVFGAALAGTQTAKAEGWVSSGWVNVGNANVVNGNDEGFNSAFSVGQPGAPTGDTKAWNRTDAFCVIGATNPGCQSCQSGAHAYCPTTVFSLTECGNGYFLTGNIAYGWSNTQYTETFNYTSSTSGYWSGFWTSAGSDGGFCPNPAFPQIAGGDWVYRY